MILSAYYGRRHKGCWRRLRRLLVHLADTGESVTLLLSEPIEDVLHPRVQIRIFRISHAPAWFGVAWFFVAANVMSVGFRLKRSLRAIIAFDCHNAFATAGASVWNASVRQLTAVRGNPAVHSNLDNRHGGERLILRAASWFGYRFTAEIIYNSAESARALEAYYKRPRAKCLIVPNDLPAVRARRVPRDEGEATAPLIIGYAGQFIDRKNVAYLIRALERLPRSCPARLLLMGDGPLLQPLVAAIARANLGDRVEITPWGEDVDSFYRRVDVFVLPTFYDDCSNALLEAMAHGLCVLGSDAGGNPEILGRDSDLLFPLTDDAIALSTCLERLAKEPAYRALVRERVRCRAQKFVFDWNEIMSDLALRGSSAGEVILEWPTQTGAGPNL